MTDASPAAIEIHDLTKRFGATTVLDGIDLTVARGQVFGYIGPNGAGKSTTVKVLAGMLGGYEGSVRVAGFDVALIPHTLSATTLGDRRPGDGVNLEADVLGKYVKRYLDRTR